MTDDEFHPLPDHVLAREADEGLLAYVGAARRAGHAHESTRGLWHLVERYTRPVRARLRTKVPDHLLEDITHDVLVDAIEAALGGKPIKNFHAWLNQVVANTVAEYYRGRHYRQLQQDREAAARERDDDESGPPAREDGVEGGYGAVELELLIEQVLERRSPTHREVIERFVFDGLSARETMQETGESENNIYKIAERFRTELRQLLEDDGGEPPGPGDGDADADADADGDTDGGP